MSVLTHKGLRTSWALMAQKHTCKAAPLGTLETRPESLGAGGATVLQLPLERSIAAGPESLVVGQEVRGEAAQTVARHNRLPRSSFVPERQNGAKGCAASDQGRENRWGLVASVGAECAAELPF